MKSQIRKVSDGDKRYDALAFVCPGCIEMSGSNSTGLHLLPVNTDQTSPAWQWDENLENPTLNPSILTGKGSPNICHSFLRAGIFEFLSDCTHSLAGQKVELPDLPDWFIKETEENNG